MRVVGHNAFMRKIVEVCRVNSLNQMSLHIEYVAIEKSYEISIADL